MVDYMISLGLDTSAVKAKLADLRKSISQLAGGSAAAAAGAGGGGRGLPPSGGGGGGGRSSGGVILPYGGGGGGGGGPRDPNFNFRGGSRDTPYNFFGSQQAKETATKIGDQANLVGAAYAELASELGRNQDTIRLVTGEMAEALGKAQIYTFYFDQIVAAQTELYTATTLQKEAVKGNFARRILDQDPNDRRTEAGTRDQARADQQRLGQRDRLRQQQLIGQQLAADEQILIESRRLGTINAKVAALKGLELTAAERKAVAEAQQANDATSLATLTQVEKDAKLRVTSLRVQQEAAVARALAAEATGQGQELGLQNQQVQEELKQLGLTKEETARIAASIRLKEQELAAQQQLTASTKVLAGQRQAETNLPGAVRTALPGANKVNPDAPRGLLQRVNFGAGALSTLRYALPSAALYGGFRAISNAVTTTNELQVEFAIIQSQLKSIGEEDAFDNVKNSIFETARATGQQVEQLASLERQLRGAFQGLNPEDNPRLAGASEDLLEEQRRAAAELAEVVGLPLTEITDGLTAAAIAFDTPFREIGDIVVSLEERTGVLGKETVNFLGDIAPVAKEAQFSLEEILVLSAQVQQRSGRSGTTLAEQFNRIIPAVQGAKDELIALAAQEPALRSIIEPLSRQDTAQVLKEIGVAFNDLTSSAQGQVISLLGGRREAGALIPALANAQQFSELLDAVNKSGGSLEDRFESVRATLSNTFERVRETLKQLFVDIAEAGLIDAFVTLGRSLEVLGSFLTVIIGPLTTVLGIFDGLPVKILATVLALKGLSRLRSSRVGKRIGDSARGALDTVRLNTTIAAGDSFRESRAGGAGRLRAGAAGAAAAGRGLFAAVGGLPTIAITGGLVAFELFSSKMAAYNDQVSQLRSEIETAGLTSEEIIQKWENAEFDFEDPDWMTRFAAFVTGKDLATGADVAYSEAIRAAEFETQAILDAGAQGGDFGEALNDQLPDITSVVAARASIINAFLDGFSAEEIEGDLDAFAKDNGLGGAEDLQVGTKEIETLGKLLSGDGGAFVQIEDVEQRRNAIRQFVDALGADDQIGALQDLINETTDPQELQAYYDSLEILLKEIEEEDPFLAEQFAALFAIGSAALSELSNEADDLLQAYENGQISQNQLESELNELIQGYEEIAQDNPSFAPEAFKNITDLQQKISDTYRSDLDAILEAIELREGDSPESYDQQIAQIEKFIKSGNLSDEDISELIPDYIGLLEARREAEAALAGSEEEAEKILGQAIAIPIEIQVAALKGKIAELGINISQVIAQSAAYVSGISQEWIDNVLLIAATSDEGLEQARREIGAKIFELYRVLNAYKTLGQQNFSDETWNAIIGGIESSIDTFQEIYNSLPTIAPPDEVAGEVPDPKDKEKEAEEAKKEAQALREAQKDLAIARARGDEVLKASIELAAAKEEYAALLNDPDAKESEKVAALAAIVDAEGNLADALKEQGKGYLSALAKFQSAIGNNVEAAALEVQAAIEEYQAAIQEFGDGSVEVANARAAVASALISQRNAFQTRQKDFTALLLAQNGLAEDAVAQADAEVKLAEFALKDAQGIDDKLKAQLRLVEAQRLAQKAMQDIRISQLELWQAELEVYEDDIGSANVAAQIASQLLADAQANGAGEAEINRLQASLLQANKAASDARIQDALDNYQFLYDTEQITREQFIEYLRSTQALLRPNSDKWRELELTIRRLQNETTGDLQNNIPANLTLPTLYEVRRLRDQTGVSPSGGAIGYQDNRNMAVNIYVTNGMNEQQVLSAFSDAVGLGRNGYDPRSY